MCPRASLPRPLLRACVHPLPRSQEPPTPVLRDSEPHPDVSVGTRGLHKEAAGPGTCPAARASRHYCVGGTWEAAERRSPCPGLTLSTAVLVPAGLSGSSPSHTAPHPGGVWPFCLLCEEEVQEGEPSRGWLWYAGTGRISTPPGWWAWPAQGSEG